MREGALEEVTGSQCKMLQEQDKGQVPGQVQADL